VPQNMTIPPALRPHQLLQACDVAAAKAGKFIIYAYDNVDQSLLLLTGLPAWKEDAKGNYVEGSINHKVAARLAQLGEIMKSLAYPQSHTAKRPGRSEGYV